MQRTPQQHVVLVTGHSGFTGRHLVDYLHSRSEPIRVVGFDLRESADTCLERQFVGDLRETQTIAAALAAARPDTIIHLAGRMPPATEDELHAANVDGTRNLLEAVRSAKLTPRVLVIGSAAEYGPTNTPRIGEDHPCNPVTAYGRTKLAQTLLCLKYCEDFVLPIVVARPFNLYGPGMPAQTVVGEICAQIAREPSDRIVRLGNLSSARDFVDIRDAVAAYWALARNGLPGEIYNVCRGHATTIRELADTLLASLDQQYSVESQTERLRARDVQRSCGDHRKLTLLTGWKPRIAFADGLRDTLASLGQAVDRHGRLTAKGC